MYTLGIICAIAEAILEIIVLLGIIVIPFALLGIAWEVGKYYVNKRNGKRCRQEKPMLQETTMYGVENGTIYFPETFNPLG